MKIPKKGILMDYINKLCNLPEVQSEKAMGSGKGAEDNVIGYSSTQSPVLQGSRREEIPEIQS